MNASLGNSGEFDLRGHTVLIIDDEPANLRVMSDYLEGSGLEVLIARDGESGLERAQCAQPDLILLDVLMPEMDGFETCRQLKADEVARDIPVIFMTVLTETQDKVKGFQLGAVDYITKPFQQEEVLARVTTHLRLRELTERLEHRVRGRTQELAPANQQLQREITERVRAEGLLRKSHQAYKALRDCNRVLVRATEEGELLQEVCRIIMEDCGYHLVWIGFAEQDEAKTVRPVAQAGYEEGYLDAVNITWADTELGRGPTGTAIRTKRPVINRDVLTDPDFAPWRAEAVERGYASSAAFPLLTSEREAIGALNVYASESDAFTPEQVDLLMELADDLMFGLASLRVRTERKQAEEARRESEERYRAIVEAFDGLVYICSQDYRVEFMNEQFLDRTGYDGTGELCYRVLHDRDSICPWCVNDRVFAGETVHWELHSPKDNHWFYVSNTPIYHADGSVSKQSMMLDITESKQAEEALRESEERFRALYEDNPSMYFMVDEQGTVLSVNPFGAAQLGYAVEELIGQSVLNVFYPDDREAVQQQLAACLEHPGKVEHWEFRKVRQDGSMLWVREAARAVQGAGGRPVVLVVCEDITERKQVEEERERAEEGQREALAEALQATRALRESEARLRVLIDQLPAEVWAMDSSLCFTLQNAASARIVGDVVGKRIEALDIPEEVKAEWLAQDRQVLDGKTLREEYQIEAEGEQKAYENIVAPVKVGDTIVGLVGMALDVTERKQAEEERERLLAQVQEQARRVQKIMDTVPEGVLLLDADCRVLLANPLGQGELATLANAQVGDTLTHLGDRSLAELLTSPPQGLWHEVATTSRFFQAIARPIEDDPTPKGWVLVIRDVTRQREVEQRIQQQERLAALGQLAAGIAHDFNNILAVISLYAGMSLRTADLPPLICERLEIVDQQTRRASDLVQQVLDFSRRAVLERGAMDLLTFLKEQINLLERTLPESIEVELVYDKGEYTVNADPTRMQQAIMNLATNARDAMPQGGRLSFGLERIHVRDRASAPLPDMEAGDWICVTITDTGAGISLDVLPHIFEPFFTTKARGRGTGLGLAQVYGIIKQHEGAIDVKPGVSAGTTFLLYLPALEVSQPQPSPSRIEQLPRGHGETVLVIEDDAVARQAVMSGLETLGYQVLQAADGLEALAVFEQHADKIELVLSDVVMPEMDGRSLFHALRQRDPAVRIVLLTGHPLEDKEFKDLRTLGLREWVPKPLSIEQLARITAQALEDVEREE